MSEDLKRPPVRQTSILWVVHGLGAGLFYALGNVFFGINCSQKGVYGGGFPGPASVILVGLYKLYEQWQVKRKTGRWVDKENSNYYKKVTKNEIDALNVSVEKGENTYKIMDEFLDASNGSDKTYQFNWVNLWVAVLSQAMTTLAGLTLVAYCFKFAKMADINQGCLPCIFSMTTFYVSLLFYFKFNEKLTALKIVGMILMLPCIGLIAFSADSSKVTTGDADSMTYTSN